MAETPIIGGIPLTEENYLSLRRAYREAVSKNQKEFIWEAPDDSKHEVVTDFAKYVLEFMETFPIIKPLIDQPDED